MEGSRDQISVAYSPELSQWRISNKGKVYGAKVDRVYGTRARNALDLMEASLNLRDAVVNRTMYDPAARKTVSVVDREATIAARGICRYAEALAVDTMVANGVQVYSPTAEELETFKVAQEPVMEYLKKNLSDPTLVDSLFSAIETAETMEDGGLTASGGGTQIAAAASQRGTLNLAAIAGIMVVLMAVVFLCTRRKGNGMEE